jgi:hypothetical protein
VAGNLKRLHRGWIGLVRRRILIDSRRDCSRGVRRRLSLEGQRCSEKSGESKKPMGEHGRLLHFAALGQQADGVAIDEATEHAY